MNRNKATHIGSCQACGNVQKLPGGKLSLHGYDVRWHFFNGVCRGAKELPYEQSFDLIEKFIEQAQDARAAIQANIANLQQPAAEPKGWYHEYINGGFREKSGYRWREVEIKQEKVEYESYVGDDMAFYTVNRYKNLAGKMTKFETYNKKPILEVATDMNAKYIEQALQPRVEELTRYIGWQKQRIAEWKLTDLTPVPPVVPPDPIRQAPRTGP